jgi:tetratricopeptide (TPR) repeat protein
MSAANGDRVRVYESLIESAHADRRESAPSGWSLSLMACLVALVAWFAFANGLRGAFCYDDNFAILSNRDVQHQSPLWPLFQHDFWGQVISKPDSHKSYRPLTVLSFRANHYFGEFDPFGYRIVNNALHAATSALLVVVAVRVFAIDSLAAFLAALMFALHPVHTEAVSGVVGRAEVLCAVLLLASVLAYARAVRVIELQSTSSPFVYRSTETRRGWFAVSVLLVLAATFAKESGFTAFGILVLLDFSHTSMLFVTPRNGASRESPMAFVRRAARTPFGTRMAALVLVAMAYMAFRKHICVNYLLLNNRRLENPVAFSRGATKLLSNMYLHAYYGLLLLWPYNLSFDYSFDCIPLVHSLADPRNLITLAMYCAIVALVAAPFWLADERGRQLLLALALFLCPFVALSNIFFTVGSTIAERLLYMPSLGFCLVVGMAASGTFLRNRQSRLFAASTVVLSVVVVLLCVSYVPTTLERNVVWGDESRLVKSALPVCGRSSKTLSNYGLLLRREGRNDDALAAFSKALEVLPTLCEQRYNIGVTLVSVGRIEDGMASLERGASCLWTMLQSMQVMRDVYQALAESGGAPAQRQLRRWADMMIKIGRYTEAAMSLEAIGTKLASLREFGDSYATLSLAHELTPMSEDAHSLAVWLANAHEMRGDFDSAVELLADAAFANDTMYEPAARDRLRILLPEMLPAAVVSGVSTLEATVNALARDADALASDDIGVGASEEEQARALQATTRLELLSHCESDSERSDAQRVLAAARYLYIHGNAERALELTSSSTTSSSSAVRRVEISVRKRANQAIASVQ